MAMMTRASSLSPDGVLAVVALTTVLMAIPTSNAEDAPTKPNDLKSTAGEAEDPVTRRVHELIYVLRLHRVFDRTDEWAGAVRELTEIGPAAVPELVRELEATDRDATLRALGFTLRAIGDRRAVPFLIRAIPKTFRTFPHDKSSTKRRFQYRMFLLDGEGAPDPGLGKVRQAAATSFGEPRKVTLPAPSASAEYLLDLDTGRKYRLPGDSEPEEAGQRPAIEADPALLKWCRQQGIELASHVLSGTIGLAAGYAPKPRKNLMQLVGLDMLALPVTSEAFNRLGVERVKEILDRPTWPQGTTSWMDPSPEGATGPCTWAIKTRDGRVGLLQIEANGTEPQTVTFRYRMSD